LRARRVMVCHVVSVKSLLVIDNSRAFSRRDVLEADKLKVFSAQPLDGAILMLLLPEMLRQAGNFLDERRVVLRLLPGFMHCLQLGMQRTAHRLAQERDTRLRHLSVYGAAADGVLDLLTQRPGWD